ncbi:VanZ family protein [Halomonas sp. HP20-15]|uniref:VanZ family protein n=1 Tax=Halomonas sp. HP20-15 TaxID=3085901 RepID=UPI0029827797|nr:VanZ family protein [Halomonas sp. HP20-15]MDW5375802.1 VanZ family protein [Halomonas sp. HP20-15]
MPAERAAYPLRRYGRRLAMVATLAVVLVIAWGSLSPAEELPANLPWDKLNHLSAYAALALVAGLAGLRPWRAAALAIIYGVAIEFAQVAVPGRQGGDWLDILANGLGALIAWLVLAAWQRFFSSRD